MAGVLLIGNLRCSLPLARALSRAGHTVWCGVDDEDPYLFTSRHIRGWFRHPPVDAEPEAALRAVEAYLAARPEIGVVAPVSDLATRLFSRNRERFAGYGLLVADAANIETCIDKAAMFELCDRIGVPLARRVIVEDYDALLQAVEDVRAPLVVKPVDAANYVFDAKALVIRAGEDAQAALPHWPAGHRSVCVQAYVDGARHDINFAAKDGRLIGAVEMEVVREDRLDRTGYMAQMISVAPVPEVRRGVEALVRALRYTGVGNVQFVVDREQGDLTFLELNPRLSAAYRTAEVCGLPLSVLHYELGMGGSPEPRPDPWDYSVGRRVVWTKGDLAGLKREWKRGALSRGQAVQWAFATARDAIRRHHLTFDPLDPAPTAWIYLHPLLRRLGLEPGRKAREFIESHEVHTASPVLVTEFAPRRAAA